MPNHVTDMTGITVGNLRVIGRHGSNARKLATWLCLCECGKKTIKVGSDLRKGKLKSCGCIIYKPETSGRLRHGLTRTKEHKAWVSMRYRCKNPKSVEWMDYGGRGITICERWNSFENFLEDMGKCPPGKISLDRIDNDKNYDPANCRWATYAEQNRNRRPSGAGRRSRRLPIV